MRVTLSRRLSLPWLLLFVVVVLQVGLPGGAGSPLLLPSSGGYGWPSPDCVCNRHWGRQYSRQGVLEFSRDRWVCVCVGGGYVCMAAGGGGEGEGGWVGVRVCVRS